MENDSREFSDLTLSRAECPKCGAVWMNGQHTWATGAKGSEEDLAGLVCNKLGDFQCINPMKGKDGGDTWEKRMEDLDKFGKDQAEKWEDRL
tara:strand:- start:243 stop:518 length:276 start_codon:yes stop_codon:yes gene_type:complete